MSLGVQEICIHDGAEHHPHQQICHERIPGMGSVKPGRPGKRRTAPDGGHNRDGPLDRLLPSGPHASIRPVQLVLERGHRGQAPVMAVDRGREHPGCP
jgi:hypothetical protein